MKEGKERGSRREGVEERGIVERGRREGVGESYGVGGLGEGVGERG